MVFDVTVKYLQGQDNNKLVNWIRGCLVNKHFIQSNKDSIDYIRDVMSSYASKEDNVLLLNRKDVFDAPEDLKKRLTIIKAKEFSIDHLVVLSSKPATMVLENIREFEVYQSMAQAYCKDDVYGPLFKYLLPRMISGKCLTFCQAGGYGDIPIILDALDQRMYDGHAKLKTISVFDRDTISSDVFDLKKGGLFKFFLNKDYTQVTENDIYSLDQQPYHWHMWYKRAIENYFSEEQFKKAGFKVKPDYDRSIHEDYIRANERYIGYNKNKLCKLTKGMVFSDYQRRVKFFDVQSERMSELQLFLFKIMQII